MNRQGRPTEPVQALAPAPETFTGNRALRIDMIHPREFGKNVYPRAKQPGYIAQHEMQVEDQ